ncbi:MAG TPA: DUF1761 domain-containing protein [Candidatus Saccharimonadales bacterium]|nr:DUF1761 domain-containing protein [Candidatus Saccharimonadales bacterium]
MFAHVSLLGVLLSALSAMVIGTIWYHQAVFGKRWMKAIGLTEAVMKERANAALGMLVIVSLVTAYALSLVTRYLHEYTGDSGVKVGVEAALLVGIGFGVTTILAHGVFEPRDKDVLYINLGNRLVTLLAMGLIIGAFIK